MDIVTLITDFGMRDYYVALLKGAILKESPQCRFIDVTHDIPPQDIMEAAFFLKGVFRKFPKEVRHVVAVNSCYSPSAQFIFFEREGHFFIGPNNGVFSLVFDDLHESEIRAYPVINGSDSLYNNVANILRLLVDNDWKDVGEDLAKLDTRINLKPVITSREIRATIVYVDHFGNVIVNLDRKSFEKVRDGRNFKIYYKTSDPITRISAKFSDVGIGEVCAYFNEVDQLELAINMGNAHELLGLNKNEMIQINFE